MKRHILSYHQHERYVNGKQILNTSGSTRGETSITESCETMDEYMNWEGLGLWHSESGREKS